jgi:hypothetical protein
MLRWLPLSLLLLAAHAHAAPLGQWVWSRADLASLAAARARRPDLAAAVSVAEIKFVNRELRSVLRLSPSTAHADAVVIRFDVSFNAAWARPAADLDADTTEVLRRVLSVVTRTAPNVRLIQLDYDCPTSQLARWAELLRAVRANGAFGQLEVWTTSLVAQLRDPAFGALFRDVVAGHIVQMFDTGEPADEHTRRELIGLLARADLPFCVGLGGFERGRAQLQVTRHEAWWDVVTELARSPRFRGTWVFAAGQNWADRAGGLP